MALGTTAVLSPSSFPCRPALPGMGPCGAPHGQAVPPTVSPTQALSPWAGCAPTGRLCPHSALQPIQVPTLHPIWHPPTWLCPPWYLQPGHAPMTALPAVPPVAPPPRPCPLVWCPPSSAHLKGLPSEVGGAELALDPALGAAVLDVLGQVAAAQLGAAPVGAGDDVEATGAEMSLGGTERVRGGGMGCSLGPPPPSCWTLPGGA